MKAKVVPPHLGDIPFEEDVKRMSEIIETLNDLYNMSYVYSIDFLGGYRQGVLYTHFGNGDISVIGKVYEG